MGSRVRAHGYGFKGTGVRVLTGFKKKKTDPARLIPVPVYPWIPVARSQSVPGTGTGGLVQVGSVGVLSEHYLSQFNQNRTGPPVKPKKTGTGPLYGLILLKDRLSN